jgi:hypothetical protein
LYQQGQALDSTNGNWKDYLMMLRIGDVEKNQILIIVFYSGGEQSENMKCCNSVFGSHETSLRVSMRDFCEYW